MINPDIINSWFKVAGGVSTWYNCVKLFRARKVQGVSVTSAVMFNTWGFWNLWYYPSLDQWASFMGGLVIVSGNTAWVTMAIYWRHNK